MKKKCKDCIRKDKEIAIKKRLLAEYYSAIEFQKKEISKLKRRK